MDVDDEDVRIIDKPTSNGKVKRNRARVVRGTLDDDDCCILDTDPGAADTVPDIVSSHNTDELVMTGEKGPVSNPPYIENIFLCVFQISGDLLAFGLRQVVFCCAGGL